MGTPDSRSRSPLTARGARQSVDLVWLLSLSHDDYITAFRGSAIRRAKDWMLRRNAAIALGNVGTADHVPALDRALRADAHPVVRGHAAWALGQIGARQVAEEPLRVLQAAEEIETDVDVLDEIRDARETIAMAS